MVIPERHDQDVAASKRGTHLVEATKVLEGRGIAEDGLLLLAECIGDGVSGDALDSRVGVLEDLSALDVEALDIGELGAGADELGNDSHLLVGVKGSAWAVEVGHAHAVAVEITSILVAETAIAVVTITTGGASALLETSTLAGMGSISSGDRVGLPDVHFRAASTNLTLTGVGVVRGRVPANNVGLTVDELDVVGALRIAVTSSVLGTGLVVALVQATVGSHLDEVESTVQTARKLGDIDVESELLTNKVEHLVLGVGLHEIGTRTNVAGVLSLGDELEGQSVTAGGDTVGA